MGQCLRKTLGEELSLEWDGQTERTQCMPQAGPGDHNFPLPIAPAHRRSKKKTNNNTGPRQTRPCLCVYMKGAEVGYCDISHGPQSH